MEDKIKSLIEVLNKKYVSHPWHGVNIGEKYPEIVQTFIEIIPSDSVKYEVDKDSGYIMVDRPQKFSNNMPCLYGFVPQTYCDKNVAEFCREKTGRDDIEGDHDPLDICVLSERNFDRGNILAEAIPVGGFRMLDGGEADDKIIAVLKGDQAYGNIKSVKDLPEMVVNRVKHFFLTYKDIEGNSKNVEITHTYDADEAKEVIKRSYEDYKLKFGNSEEELEQELKKLFF